jgi:hypothetical protein
VTKRNRIPTICGAAVALAFATLATGCSSPTTPPENIFMFSRPEYSQSEALVVGQGTMVDVIAP